MSNEAQVYNNDFHLFNMYQSTSFILLEPVKLILFIPILQMIKQMLREVKLVPKDIQIAYG